MRAHVARIGGISGMTVPDGGFGVSGAAQFRGNYSNPQDKRPAPFLNISAQDCGLLGAYAMLFLYEPDLPGRITGIEFANILIGKFWNNSSNAWIC